MNKDRRLCRVSDLSGEILRCEFSLWIVAPYLQVQRDPEITLCTVLFEDLGTLVYGGTDHARFLSIVREDRDFSHHLNWSQIQSKCRDAYLHGQSDSLPKTMTEALA